jgi:hypothetical protein
MDVVELYLISCAHWSRYEVIYLCCVGSVCTYTHIRYICLCMSYNMCIVLACYIYIYSVVSICTCIDDVYTHAFESYIVHNVSIWIVICVLTCVHEICVPLHACTWIILYAFFQHMDYIMTWTYVYIMYVC